MAKQAGKRREEKELFRLPIDRVFTMEGFGTVVTGTLIEGMCEAGEEVMVYPQERLLKIRAFRATARRRKRPVQARERLLTWLESRRRS